MHSFSGNPEVGRQPLRQDRQEFRLHALVVIGNVEGDRPTGGIRVDEAVPQQVGKPRLHDEDIMGPGEELLRDLDAGRRR